MSYELRRIDGTWHIGTEGAAEMCGVTHVTFRKWLDQPDPPPFNYHVTMAPLGALGDWIGRKRLFKTGRGGGFPYMPDLSKLQGKVMVPGIDPEPVEPDKLDKLAEETRLTKIKADMAEIELAEKKGKLIDAEIVTDGWIKLVLRVKTRLLKLPTSLAPLVVGETDPFEVQKRLDAGVREALEGLSGNDDDEDGETDD